MIDIIFRYDPTRYEPPAPPASPDEARERLLAGNREFMSLVDLPEEGERTTRILPFNPSEFGVADEPGAEPRQRPFAAVLGCSDARVPVELVFSQACNSLFVVRVAGNVLGSECLGSLQYAVGNLGEHLKLLVVLGHSGCGAVTAAVDAFITPARYLSVASSHGLRAIVDGLLVSVRAAAHALERVRGREAARAPGYRRALVETAVGLNAALTARMLYHEFRGPEPTRPRVVYAVYDLVTREVNLPAGAGAAGSPGLFDPPVDADEFDRLGLVLAASSSMTRLLEQA
jgi:carbonic anhydrase